MRRLYAAVLAAALVSVVGCSPDASPAPTTPSPTPTAEPTPSAVAAWDANAPVRPDWVGRDAPWLWEYSDDVVVIGPRGLVALDRETGAEVWRLPLGGPVCGATPVPSEVGLVAVSVGRCQPASQPTRGGSRIATGGTATARRTVIKGVDLESASVVWQRPFVGAPVFDVGGEVLLATAGCGARRLDLSTGTTLSRIDAACSDQVLIGHGVAMVSTMEAPREWRAIDVESGSSIAEVTPPATMSDPRRILTADPLTVLAGHTHDDHLQLVRVDSEGLRVLDDLSPVAAGAFFASTGDSLVLADQDWPGATEFALDDGSALGGFPGVGAARWIPVAHLGDGVLGFEGDEQGLNAGHGRLTLRSLHDGSVTELSEFGGATLVGDTNLAIAAPKAVVIGDILLMPGHANASVLAYRLTLPDD